MSCVIGLVTKDGVIVGWDTAASDGNVIIQNSFPKVIIRDVGLLPKSDKKPQAQRKIGIGISGSVKYGHAVAHFLEVPEHDLGDSAHEYVIKKFVPAFRKALAEESGKSSVSCDDTTSCLLVAFMGRVFFMDQDLSPVENTAGYDSIGSGREIALGSLHTSGVLDIEDVARVNYALNAAGDLTVFVKEPYRLFLVRK